MKFVIVAVQNRRVVPPPPWKNIFTHPLLNFDKSCIPRNAVLSDKILLEKDCYHQFLKKLTFCHIYSSEDERYLSWEFRTLLHTVQQQVKPQSQSLC